MFRSNRQTEHVTYLPATGIDHLPGRAYNPAFRPASITEQMHHNDGDTWDEPDASYTITVAGPSQTLAGNDHKRLRDWVVYQREADVPDQLRPYLVGRAVMEADFPGIKRAATTGGAAARLLPFLDLSWTHLPQAEVEMIDDAPVTVRAVDVVAWVHVPPLNDGYDDLTVEADPSWSRFPRLLAVLRAARDQYGAFWVHFDPDGYHEIPGLPHFEGDTEVTDDEDEAVPA